MMYFLISVFLTLCVNFGTALRHIVFSPILGQKQKKVLLFSYGILAIVNILFVMGAMHIWGLTAAFNYLRYGGILYAAVQTAISILVIRKKTQEQMFVAGTVLTYHYLLMSIPNYIITFLHQPDAQSNLFVILLIYTLVLLVSYWPMRRLLRYSVTAFLENETQGYWKTIWFIPIVFFGTKFLGLGGEHNTGGISQLLSNGLYITVIVLICMSVASGQRRVKEQMQVHEHLAAQKRYYEDMKENVEAARKYNHDFKQYIAAIRHYTQIDDKEGLCRFCDDLVDSYRKETEIPYTGNIAADGVVYHYIEKCREENVNISYSGTIRSSGISDVDLCVLLGNALENALAGCLTIPENRRIQLVCQSEQQVLSILVHNTFDGKINQIHGEFESRKQEGRIGVGMRSMKEVVTRYGGTMDTDWDENSFRLVFILPITTE